MKDYTKEHLCAILKDLMKTKTISQIRVSELCSICEINRSTFYYHFDDKYELLIYALFSPIMEKEPHDYDSSIDIVRQMLENRSIYKNAARDLPESYAHKYVVRFFYGTYLKIIQDKLAPEPVDERTKYILKAYCEGITKVNIDWFLDPHNIDVEQMVQWTYDAMPEYIRDLLSK